MHMETFEVKALNEWLVKLKKHGYFNRKWWPTPEDTKEVLSIVNLEQPRWFIEFGTGNGIMASLVAVSGFEVVTFDPVDRPKIFEDESFPFKSLYKSIHNMHHYTQNYGMDYWIGGEKTVWFIDVAMGEKTIASIKQHIAHHQHPGDVIITRRSNGIQVDKV